MKKYITKLTVLVLLVGSLFSVNQAFAESEETQLIENEASLTTEEPSMTAPDEKEMLEQETPNLTENTLLEDVISDTQNVQNEPKATPQVASQEVVLSEEKINEESPKATSWIAEELDGNRPFIDATITATKKTEDQITLEDLAKVKALSVTGASSIPDKISDYIQLEELYVTDGTVSKIPDSLFQLKQTLTRLYLTNNRFVVLPAKLFDDSFWQKKLIVIARNNQIVSDIPPDINASGMLKFNSKNNMLEHYNYGDYYDSLQAQLSYQGATPVITVPIGYDFNQVKPDTTNLKAYSKDDGYLDLFPGHEFVYYDAGNSPNIMKDGVTTNVGRGRIKVKSAFSTNTNRFAQTDVTVVVEQGAKVTSHFVDEKGHQLADDKVYTGLVGKNYTTEAAAIENYEVSSIQGNPTGVYTVADQEVTYVYTQLDGETVYVHHEDTDGNELMDPLEVNGKMGDAYETKAEAIAGYELVEVPDNHTGTFTNIPQDVVYIYNKLPDKIGQVVVTYLNEDGEMLAEEMILTGPVGTTYTAKEEQFDGYKLKEIKGKPTGDFLEVEQMVSYIYEKITAPIIIPPSTIIPPEDEVDPDPMLDPIKPVIPSTNLPVVHQETPKEVSLKLPLTGESSNTMLIIVGAIAIIIGAGYFYKSNKKNKE